MRITHLGAVLRLLRKQKGLSLRAVQELSGVSYSHLSQLERGVTPGLPRLETLERLAAAYGTTCAAVLERARGKGGRYA